MNVYAEIPAEIKKDLKLKYPFSKAKRSAWRKCGVIVLTLFAFFLFIARAFLEKKSLNRLSHSPDQMVANHNKKNKHTNFHTDISDETVCPKCDFVRKSSDSECPMCGIIYKKYKTYIADTHR